MIPKAYIDAWRRSAPWQLDAQIEQDLVISRALVQIFSDGFLRENLGFRGGTAIHKLFLNPPVRYSEDIDLVQLQSGPIKPILQALRDQLLFLGDEDDRSVDLKEHNCTVFYNFETELPPPPKMKVKIEINTREHFHVMDLKRMRLSIDNKWYSGNSDIVSYQPEELLGTKLRALYQRKKGRDLFDLHYAMNQMEIDPSKIVQCFRTYIKENGNQPPTSREFELNMKEKMEDEEFIGDIEALLRPGINFQPDDAWKHVNEQLIQRL